MKNNKKRSSVLTALMFVLAATLLLTGGIGGTRAALTYYSENYTSRVQTAEIGVTITENGQPVEGDLLTGLGEDFHLGQSYDLALAATNSGEIDEYVRVILYKYWVDADGNKLTNLSPALIQLNMTENSGWIVDEDASTVERTVLYYSQALAVGETTQNLVDSLVIDNSLATKVTQTSTTENGLTTITTSYDYDGVSFRIEAEVDAVQSHNAQDAIGSAWGRKVTVEDGTLRLE